MKSPFFACCFFLIFSCSAYAQRAAPPVDELIEEHDADGDGTLSADEVVDSRYQGQFPRWDADGDGKASRDEIVAFRARFGIGADGMRRSGNNRRATQPPAFSIPDVEELTRVNQENRPTRAQAQNSAWILDTREHPPIGDRYVILTDHQSDDFLQSLERLAEHHDGSIIRVDDLAMLYSDSESMDSIALELANARFVALAPRLESFRENMLLGAWDLLTSIDDDPQLDVYPGILLASDSESMEQLVSQSIEHQPIALTDLMPFAISQVQNSTETRSLQKSGILRNYFDNWGRTTPTLAIYGPRTDDAPRLEGDHLWEVTMERPRQSLLQFPSGANEAFQNANLIVMHGHGIPGMSCSVDVDALPNDLSGKILLTGSCFSAAPVKTDLEQITQAPGGYEVEQRESFVVHAIDSGAVVAFGHQRLCSGFPHLFPVLESWTEGETVGQAYQEVMNALIALQPNNLERFAVARPSSNSGRLPQNSLLYIVIGDPALQPIRSDQTE